jgi:hypothetical protein
VAGREERVRDEDLEERAGVSLKGEERTGGIHIPVQLELEYI